MWRARWFFIALLGCGLAGCAGYRPGPTGGQVAGARSIRVPFVRNTTIEARLSEPATFALRRQLQQDGTFNLETGSGAADLVVDATIEEYDRIPMAFLRRDVISVQEYEIRMTVHVIVREFPADKTVLDRRIVARTSVLVGPDQTASERQATPLLAEDFARKATIYIAEGSW
jgi:hypothetical protein